MVAGMLIYTLRKHVSTPWALLGVIPLIPTADGLANGACAWPMWLTLNQHDVSWFATYVACGVTLGLCLYAVWFISLAVARPESEIGGTIIDQVKALILPSGNADPAADLPISTPTAPVSEPVVGALR
jgi:hypothetical protein